MANARYDKFAELIANTNTGTTFSWTTDTIKAALINTAYTLNTASDQYFSACNTYVVGGSTPQTLTSKTLTAGKLTCGTITWSAVPTGNTAKYVVFYKDTGNNTTSPLIVVDDTTTGVTLPVATNGGDITYTPDGTNGVIKI